MSNSKPVPGKDGNRYVPFEERTGENSVVFFTRDLSEEGLKKVYDRVSSVLSARVAIKLHTGDAEGPNIIPRPWVKEQIATLCLKRNRQRMKKPSLIAGSIAAAAVLGLVLNMAFPGENLSDFDTAGWAAVPEAQEAQSVQTEAPAAVPAQPQNMSPENKEFRIT